MDKTTNILSINKRRLIYIALVTSVAVSLTLVYQSDLLSPVSVPGQTMKVAGISMQPVLQPGDQVTLRKGLDYSNGDLVAIQFPTRERPMVKRILALPGDTLEFDNGKVKLNGTPLNTAWWPDGKTLNPRSYRVLEKQLEHYGNMVPENNVIVMGDNVQKSYDSGKYGMLSTDRIIARIDTPANQDKKLSALYGQTSNTPATNTIEADLPVQEDVTPQEELVLDEGDELPVVTEQLPRDPEVVKANELGPYDRDSDHEIDPNNIEQEQADIQDAVQT